MCLCHPKLLAIIFMAQSCFMQISLQMNSSNVTLLFVRSYHFKCSTW